MDMNAIVKKFLGHRVRDRVTGAAGVVTTVTFDLNGCVQCGIQPRGLKEDGSRKHAFWSDVQQLTVLSERPVSPVAAFDAPTGSSPKPPR